MLCIKVYFGECSSEDTSEELLPSHVLLCYHYRFEIDESGKFNCRHKLLC